MWAVKLYRAERFSKHSGRGVTHRILTTDRDLSDLCWPGVRQVFRITRTTNDRVGCRYFATSLNADRASPAELMQLVRGHWAAIENKQHWVRDAVLGEDRCRVRTGQAPWALAGLRLRMIDLLRSLQLGGPTAALTYLSARLENLLCVIGVKF